MNKFPTNEHGQTTAEYATVLMLTTLATLASFTKLGSTVANGIKAAAVALGAASS